MVTIWIALYFYFSSSSFCIIIKGSSSEKRNMVPDIDLNLYKKMKSTEDDEYMIEFLKKYYIVKKWLKVIGCLI